LLQAAKIFEIPLLSTISTLLSQMESQTVAMGLILAIACQALLGLWFGNMDLLTRLDPTCSMMYILNIIFYLGLALAGAKG
jgi:hypothetical protein